MRFYIINEDIDDEYGKWCGVSLDNSSSYEVRYNKRYIGGSQSKEGSLIELMRMLESEKIQ